MSTSAVIRDMDGVRLTAAQEAALGEHCHRACGAAAAETHCARFVDIVQAPQQLHRLQSHPVGALSPDQDELARIVTPCQIAHAEPKDAVGLEPELHQWRRRLLASRDGEDVQPMRHAEQVRRDEGLERPPLVIGIELAHLASPRCSRSRFSSSRFRAPIIRYHLSFLARDVLPWRRRRRIGQPAALGLLLPGLNLVLAHS
jgi:hypothetical protein